MQSTVAYVQVGPTIVLQLLQEAGVASHAQMGRMIQAQKQQLQRTLKFQAHALVAQDRQQHATHTVQVGARPVCVACRRVGTHSKAFNWVQQACDMIMHHEMNDTHQALAAAAASTRRLIELLQMLRSC